MSSAEETKHTWGYTSYTYNPFIFITLWVSKLLHDPEDTARGHLRCYDQAQLLDAMPCCHAVLQVPATVLAACAELMASHAHAAAMPAQRMAGILLMHAVDGLPTSTAGTESRSSSGSGLTAMLWQQIEQSDLLQQLPGQLSIETAQHIRTPYRHSVPE
jgi:hypothetical protein